MHDSKSMASAIRFPGLIPPPGAAPKAARGSGVAKDPIFAAIKRHARAYKKLEKAFDRSERLAAENKNPRVTYDDIEKEQTTVAEDKQSRRVNELFSTIPTTKAGVRALLEFARDYEVGRYPNLNDAFFATLLCSPVLAGE